jgi:hypothetical protein
LPLTEGTEREPKFGVMVQFTRDPGLMTDQVCSFSTFRYIFGIFWYIFWYIFFGTFFLVHFFWYIFRYIFFGTFLTEVGGSGEMRTASGDVYYGSWKAGKKHGKVSV